MEETNADTDLVFRPPGAAATAHRPRLLYFYTPGPEAAGLDPGSQEGGAAKRMAVWGRGPQERHEHRVECGRCFDVPGSCAKSRPPHEHHVNSGCWGGDLCHVEPLPSSPM
ncbi:hypothetical protein NDU88_001201 [Pleurodeles waltl]|uniref:Uncharacterized protein n=1 Tax=Pleurodeles waltl TaxID=8319 RepID=A0AAV7U7T3_PLEWA|nr:hypothetical protein NDU88_001201 [Pleurodeles waltl]